MLLTALLLLATAPTPRPSPPVATVAPVATRAPLAGPQGLADTAKGRRLNRSVSFDQTTVPAQAEEPIAPKKKGVGKAERAQPDPDANAVVDMVQGQEKKWKGRKAGLEADLKKAKADLDIADGMNTVSCLGTPGNAYFVAMAARNAALTPYRMTVEKIERELAGLAAECAASPFCQPGWVR